MANQVNIIGIGTYLPKKIVRNSDFNYASVGLTDEAIKKLGLVERRHADIHEGIIDLAYNASLRAIKNARISASDIDLILFASASIEKIVPVPAIDIQKRLGIIDCMSLQFVDGCCAFLTSMEMGAYAIMSGQAKNVLIVSAERFSGKISFTTELSYLTGMSVGDSAGAMILSCGDRKLGNGKLSSYFNSSPDFRAGFTIRPCEATIGLEKKCGIFLDYDFESVLNGYQDDMSIASFFQRIKEHGLKLLPNCISKALNKVSYTDDDIDFYILHQPTREFIEIWKQNANIHKNKTLDTFDKYANLSSVTVVANLDMAYQLGKIKKGDTILLASLGEGITVGATIWKWQLEKDDEHCYLISE